MTTACQSTTTGGGGGGDVPPAPPAPPPPRHHENLRRIYDEMRSRQLRAIGKAGCLRADPSFVPDGKLPPKDRCSAAPSLGRATDSIAGDASTDERRCLAVSSIIDGSVECRWTDDFVELVRRLRDEFGRYGLTFARDPDDAEFGGGGQLHWTLMQLVGFAEYESEVLGMSSDDGIGDEAGNDEDSPRSASSSPYTSDHYLDTVQDSLTVGGLDAAVTVTYVGVMVVSTGLLMIGLPSLDANAARDAVRSRLARRDLPLREPFVNDIVHSTLYRVASGAGADGVVDDIPPDLHLRLAALAEEYRDVELGTVVLDRFQIGPASWRVLPDEVGATPPLRSWTLPPTAPRQSYGEAVSAEEDGGGGRGCHTVSGASGANLAREVRRALSRQSSLSSEAEQRKENVPTNGRDRDLPVKAVIGRRAAASPISNRLEEMKNSPEELYERISSMNVRDSLPRGGEVLARLPSFGEGGTSSSSSPSRNGREEEGEEEEIVRDNAATVSGAGGAALGRELLRKLEDERRELDRLYYTDFH